MTPRRLALPLVLGCLAVAAPAVAEGPVTGMTPTGRPDPRPGAVVESPFEPVIVPDPSPEAIRYHESGRWIWGLAQLWGLAVPALLMATGFSARMRDTSWNLSRRIAPESWRRGRWLVAVAVYGLLFLLVATLLSLPLAYFAGFVRPHAYGLSNQTLGRWLNLRAINLGISIVLTIPVLWVVWGLIHWTPRRWWLVVGLLAVPVGLAMAMVKPVLIDPLTHDFGPMRDKALEARILALADRSGIDGSRVYEIDMSRDTKAVNAYVTGFLGTKRIVLWDTLLTKLDDDQVLAVMAHEMGHYALGHVARGMLVSSALLLVGLFGVHWGTARVLRRFGPRWGVQRLSDIAALPALLLVARLIALVLTPIGYAYSRHIELEADRFALELTRDNRAVATAFVALQRENLSHPRPGRLDTALRSTHPSLGERIDFSNAYRPWELGHPLRYGHLFRTTQEVAMEDRPPPEYDEPG